MHLCVIFVFFSSSFILSFFLLKKKIFFSLLVVILCSTQFPLSANACDVNIIQAIIRGPEIDKRLLAMFVFSLAFRNTVADPARSIARRQRADKN